MLKDEALNHWHNIKPNQEINIAAVPYKHKGSTFDQDGIRLTGSKEFIDSVLSRLKDLLQYEGDTTRLQLVYQQSKDKDTGAALDSYNCYIQVHGRGREAIILNGFIGNARARQSARAAQGVPA